MYNKYIRYLRSVASMICLTVNFKGYTEEWEQVCIGIFKKMGVKVAKYDDHYIISTQDEEIINYVKYLAYECDDLNIED